jgi:carbamoyltransferase
VSRGRTLGGRVGSVSTSASRLLRYAGRGLWPNRARRFPRVTADRILGIACTGHGASLAYMDTDGTVRSSQLERWTGTKHMMMFSEAEYQALLHPTNAIDRNIDFIFRHTYGRFPDSCTFEDSMMPWLGWLLRGLDVGPADIDLVVTSDGHFATGWTRLGPELRRWFPRARIVTAIEHHEIHQRQAFWASGFDEAAVLTLDTCGESLPRLGGRKLSATIATMDVDGGCKVHREFLFPETSAGTMYDATTHHVGFRQGDAGKTMGLAPFGGPELYDSLRGHLRLHDDGGFTFLGGEDYREALERYTPGRMPGAEITQRHRDVAYAGQAILDPIVSNAWRAALDLTGLRSLVYAGGVALNSVSNGKAWRDVRPDRLYIPPNPGDPGQGLGCAMFGAYELAGWDPPRSELPEYLGPAYGTRDLDPVVAAAGVATVRPPAGELASLVARCMANGHIVGRVDGGAEFGPRALGNRSILCDPRRPGMKDYLNLRVKHREPFRPFAPAVLAEHAEEWFDLDGRSPYMLRVAPIRPDRLDRIPAVAHVDGTARVQTVAGADNPGFRDLIGAFHGLTGVPLVVNTSFNLAGRPIVETPGDAVECFTSTEIDVLVLGPHVLSKRPLAHYLDTDSGA